MAASQPASQSVSEAGGLPGQVELSRVDLLTAREHRIRLQASRRRCSALLYLREHTATSEDD